MANQQPGTEGLAILLYGVWRAMHEGACPNCHTHRLPELMDRDSIRGIRCPHCGFYVLDEECAAIQQLNAPALTQSVVAFKQWRKHRAVPAQALMATSAKSTGPTKLAEVDSEDFKDQLEGLIDGLQDKVNKLGLALAAARNAE